MSKNEIAGMVQSIAEILGTLAKQVESLGSALTDEELTPEPQTEPKEEPQTERDITLEDVRAVLADKSRAGYTDQVKELITKYGSERLSEVDPVRYADLLKEAEVIGT